MWDPLAGCGVGGGQKGQGRHSFLQKGFIRRGEEDSADNLLPGLPETSSALERGSTPSGPLGVGRR